MLRFVACTLIACLISSCAPGPTSQREAPGADNSSPRYSVVFIIHGDGEYLYFDTSGNEHIADDEILRKAKVVAESNPAAEVFIFHERPLRSVFLFFPVPDGDFSYYRNGRLISNESYWRSAGRSRFEAELDLYNKFAHRCNGKDPPPMRVFAYFGHEIPEFGAANYDQSYPDRRFTVDDLADGLRGIARERGMIDIVILSSCFGGSPHTIAALSPFAQYIVTSPDNLHLSYFDLHSLEGLDRQPFSSDPGALAFDFAQNAFARLERRVLTAVTVAVYDVSRVRPYLDSVIKVYNNRLDLIGEENPALIEHCDCVESSDYVLSGMSTGVQIFYRPPRFGRQQNKLTHSGWECWKLADERSGTSENLGTTKTK